MIKVNENIKVVFSLNGKKISKKKALELISPKQLSDSIEDLKMDPYLDAGYMTREGELSITIE